VLQVVWEQEPVKASAPEHCAVQAQAPHHHTTYLKDVYLLRIVIPLSLSKVLLSIDCGPSALAGAPAEPALPCDPSWGRVNKPPYALCAWVRILSTRVVLPWSMCAITCTVMKGSYLKKRSAGHSGLRVRPYTEGAKLRWMNAGAAALSACAAAPQLQGRFRSKA
jgi:hypothetical protein